MLGPAPAQIGSPSTKLIGLLGGLGPAATGIYYTELLQECARLGVQPRIIINHASVEVVLAEAEKNNLEGMAGYLAVRLLELIAAGAEVLAISAVTPHICGKELSALIPGVLLDIVDVLNAEIRRNSIRRIAIMGTGYSTTMLGKRVEAQVVSPTSEFAATIGDLYLSIVREGRATDHISNQLSHLAKTMLQDLKVDAIVLAGTEFSLVPKIMWHGIPVLDCGDLHVKAIVRESMR